MFSKECQSGLFGNDRKVTEDEEAVRELFLNLKSIKIKPNILALTSNTKKLIIQNGFKII